jgi:hypothetical protein
VDPDENINFTPAFLFESGAPGDTITSEVTVQNQTGADVDFVVDLADMEEGRGNSAAREFVPVGDARRGAGMWIDAIRPATFHLDAATERTIPITIRIPEDAGHGGFYAAIVFTAKDPRPDVSVPINQTAPVPVLVTVEGDFERDLRVEVDPNERVRWRGGTATWTVELHNAGDIHEVFAGRLRVDGPLSSARSKPIRPGILLPGEHRRQRITFELRDAPDLVGAKVRVERDDGPGVSAKAARVLVLPWWLLVLLALAIAVIWWRLRTRRGTLDESWDSVEDEGSWGPSPPAG